MESGIHYNKGTHCVRHLEIKGHFDTGVKDTDISITASDISPRSPIPEVNMNAISGSSCVQTIVQ